MKFAHSIGAAAALMACSILVAPGAFAQATYQAQQQQYQDQLQQNQRAQQDYQDQKQEYRDRRARYDDQTAAYEALRAHFAVERAGYHRYVWPVGYDDWRLKNDSSVMNVRVNLVGGNPVGNVAAVARARDGVIEGLEVELDSGKVVWIDAEDARFDRFHGTVVTDLYASDLRHMADERIG